jgi:hypothetical protein
VDEYPKHSDDFTPEKKGNNFFGILRYKYLIKKDSYVGGIYTGKEFSSGFNRMGGMDSKIRISGFMTLDTFFLYSLYKDPDIVDQKKGTAFGGRLNYESRKYYAILGYSDLSKNFELDPGRLLRNGIRIFSADAGRYFYTHSDFLKRITLGYTGHLARDKHFDMNDYSHTFSLTFEFPSQTHLRFGYDLATEVYEGVLFDKNRFFIDAQSQVAKYLKLRFSYGTGRGPYYFSLLQGNLSTLSFYVNFHPGENFSTEFNLKRHIFHADETNTKIYDIGIYRNKTTFQVNKYLFLRGIIEYNSDEKKILWDSLLGFTYIPGTVIYLGYGSSLEKERYVNDRFTRYDHFKEARSTLFFKASYLFRF